MKDDGFTLLEVITVFSLIGILMVVSMPRISANFRYMDRIAEGFLGDARFIQMEAMKGSSGKYRIAVNSGTGRYYLKSNTVIIKTVLVKERYKIKYTGTGELYFNADGTPVHPGTFTITDTKTREEKSVTVVPATGRTIIKE